MRNLVVREKTRIRRRDAFKALELFKITRIFSKCVGIARGKVSITYEQNARIMTLSNFRLEIAENEKKIQTNGFRKIKLVSND